MASIERFEDIRAWQVAREMVKTVYRMVAESECRFDVELKRQLCSSALSTMSNIAEGFGRGNDGDFARFLDISRGSASEVQSLLYVSTDVGYLKQADVEAIRLQVAECIAMIAALQRYLKKDRRVTKRV